MEAIDTLPLQLQGGTKLDNLLINEPFVFASLASRRRPDYTRNVVAIVEPGAAVAVSKAACL